MPPNYTPWTWSPPHGRHYSYQITDDGAIINTFWSGPVAPAAPVAPSSIDATVTAPTSSTPRYSQQPSVVVPTNRSIPGGSYPSEIYTLNPKPTEVIRVEDDESNAEDGNKVEEDEKEEPRIDSPHEAPYKSSNTLVPRPASNTSHTQQYANTVVYGSTQCSPYRNTSYEPSLGYQLVNPYTLPVNAQTFRPTIASLPLDVQADIGYKDRRFIQTSTDQNDLEQLDTRYRRVARPHHPYFFIPGRVFKMLWTEPAGQANPGRTRNSTHFSMVWCGEQAFSEIRRFVVVRNKGTFSQCIPIQTYKGRGATKPGLVMNDHGVIHTSKDPPGLISGENLTKYSIRVESTAGETLDVESRVNYGKAYAVEHNVKVLDIGMVMEGHRYLISTYFDRAMRGQ